MNVSHIFLSLSLVSFYIGVRDCFFLRQKPLSRSLSRPAETKKGPPRTRHHANHGGWGVGGKMGQGKKGRGCRTGEQKNCISGGGQEVFFLNTHTRTRRSAWETGKKSRAGENTRKQTNIQHGPVLGWWWGGGVGGKTKMKNNTHRRTYEPLCWEGGEGRKQGARGAGETRPEKTSSKKKNKKKKKTGKHLHRPPQ